MGICFLNNLAYGLTQGDRHLFLFLNHSMGCRPLDRVMPAITNLGLGHVQALAILVAAVIAGFFGGEIRKGNVLRSSWAAIVRRSPWVVPMLLAIAVSGLMATAIKTVHRDRPWWFYTQEHKQGRYLDVQVRTVPGEYPLKTRGFPSGHTATSFALAGVVVELRRRGLASRRAAVCLVVLAPLVALSRIYLASHWPLDVLGGIVVGLMSAWGVCVWVERASERKRVQPVAIPETEVQ